MSNKCQSHNDGQDKHQRWKLAVLTGGEAQLVPTRGILVYFGRERLWTIAGSMPVTQFWRQSARLASYPGQGGTGIRG
jgi:hypothetical protein